MKKVKNILIIEDNPADQLIIEMIIENAETDANVVFASDGKEGLETISQMDQLPDIILLDINMPRMNGHEFLEAYSAKYHAVPPVVIMLTSSSQEDDKAKTSRYACVRDYLIKPFSEEALNKLDDYIDW